MYLLFIVWINVMYVVIVGEGGGAFKPSLAGRSERDFPHLEVIELSPILCIIEGRVGIFHKMKSYLLTEYTI